MSIMQILIMNSKRTNITLPHCEWRGKIWIELPWDRLRWKLSNVKWCSDRERISEVAQYHTTYMHVCLSACSSLTSHLGWRFNLPITFIPSSTSGFCLNIKVISFHHTIFLVPFSFLFPPTPTMITKKKETTTVLLFSRAKFWAMVWDGVLTMS